MKLVSTPANPVPPANEVSRIRAADGVGLRVARWDARSEIPRGTVTIFQGRGEFIEKWAEPIGELLERGFCVVAFDWRGQGASDRALAEPRKGHVKRFRHYVRDVEAVAAQVLAACPKPHFVLAHSALTQSRCNFGFQRQRFEGRRYHAADAIRTSSIARGTCRRGGRRCGRGGRRPGAKPLGGSALPSVRRGVCQRP